MIELLFKNKKFQKRCLYLTILFLFVPLSGQNNTNDDFNIAIDSLRSLSKRSPERGIQFAREILNKNYSIAEENKSRILNILGEIYLDLGIPSLALSSFIDAGQKSKSKYNAWNKINIGNVYFQQKDWTESKRKYLDALRIFRGWKNIQPNNVLGRSVALSNLGRIEMYLKNYDDALVYFKDALNVKRSSAPYKAYLKTRSELDKSYLGQGIGVAYQHTLLAKLYTEWGIFDMAVEQLEASDSLLNYMNQSIRYKKKQNPTLEYRRETELGINHSIRMRIFAKQNNFPFAHDESKKAKQFLIGKPFHLVEHYKNEAELFIKQDSLYKSLESIDKGLKECALNGMSTKEIDLLQYKVELLKANNLERSALDFANTIIEKREAISESRMSMLIESLNYKIQLHNDKQDLVKAKKRELLIFIITGSLLIIIGVIIIGIRNRKRALGQKEKILIQEKQISEAELKNKESELVKMSAYIVSKNDLLNSIGKDLDYHTSLLEKKSDRKLMEPLKRKIQNKIDDSADWEVFNNQFSHSYPDFVNNLNRNYPNLRSPDIKLCCYMKMNMNTKEIARVTGLSVRAVENKRYRLRKKLDLDAKTTLENFINSVNNLY